MAITVILPNALRPYAAYNERVPLEASTAAEALTKLMERYPEIKARLPQDLAVLPPGMGIYRNSQDLRGLQGLETPLREDDRLTIIVPEGDM
ncbi:MAG TPA: MoaD/ThiS family protein [Herpetosiphonaceae bacterium]